ASFGQNDLIIKELDNIDEVNMFHGDEKSFRGYIADGPLKTRKGTQIEFSKSINKNQEQFITLFEINKKNINTKETSPISLKDISIQKKANKFKIYLKGEMLIETNL